MRWAALALCLAIWTALAPLPAAAQSSSGSFQFSTSDGTRFECTWRMWTEHWGTMHCEQLGGGLYWFDCTVWAWSWGTTLDCHDRYGNTWST